MPDSRFFQGNPLPPVRDEWKLIGGPATAAPLCFGLAGATPDWR